MDRIIWVCSIAWTARMTKKCVTTRKRVNQNVDRLVVDIAVDWFNNICSRIRHQLNSLHVC